MSLGAERLAAALAGLDPDWRESAFCVALSGGVDSVVLLHAMQSLRARDASFRLRAAHVNHGLQAQAPDWASHCRSLCAALAVPLTVLELKLAPAGGESVEAQARGARYAALAGLLQAGEWLLTAHHQDDQLETVLIQLLRGADVAGLAAMPAAAPLGAGRHGRPLLGVERNEIAEYAALHGLGWQRDPMNESARFDRGFLRGEILPRLRERWPGAAATVSRSAGHLGQAARLLDDLARLDARAAADGARLTVEGLQRLSRDRQSNLLRWWLRDRGLRPPPAARLAAVVDEMLPARADAQPLVRWEDGEIRRYRGRLYAMRPLPPVPEPAVLGQGAEAAIELGPGCGRFRLVHGREGGLRVGLPGPLEIGFRGGGETLRPALDRPRKRLKDLCQEAGIVPWMRERLPLVHAGDRLVAVGDLWMEADCRAAPGSEGWLPVWEERPELV